MPGDEQPCVFCEIAAGTAGTRLVHEDPHTVAFFPLEPATLGHTRVVPRRHSADLWEMDDTTARHVMRAVLRVGRALRSVLAPDGMNVVSSAGEAATQTVFHTHVHLVPRRAGDAMGRLWPAAGAGFRFADDAAADALAARVADAARAGSEGEDDKREVGQ